MVPERSGFDWSRADPRNGRASSEEVYVEYAALLARGEALREIRLYHLQQFHFIEQKLHEIDVRHAMLAHNWRDMDQQTAAIRAQHGAPHPSSQSPQLPHPHPYPYLHPYPHPHQQQQQQLPGPHHGYQQLPSQSGMGNRHPRGRVSPGNPHPQFPGEPASRQQRLLHNVQGGVSKQRGAGPVVVVGPVGPNLHNTQPARPVTQQDNDPTVMQEPAPAPCITPPATAGGAAAASAAATAAGAGAAMSNPARIGRGVYKPRRSAHLLPPPDLP